MEPSSYSRPQMRPPGRPVVADGTGRTPVAWRQREYNLTQQQQQQQQEHQNHNHSHSQLQEQEQMQRSQKPLKRRGGSQPLSSTDTTAEDEDEEEVEEEEDDDDEQRGADGDESSELETSVSGQRKRQQQQQQQQQQQRHRQRYNRIHQSHCAALKTQTIRSTRSVPALEGASWPAEGGSPNCPVHGGYPIHPAAHSQLLLSPLHHLHPHHPRHVHMFDGNHGRGVYPGEPYLVSVRHNMRRAGSMFDLRPAGGQLAGGHGHYYPPPPSVIYAGSLQRPLPMRYGPTPPPPPPPPLFHTLESKKKNGANNKNKTKTSHYGSLRSLHGVLHPLAGPPRPPINPFVLPPPVPLPLPPMLPPPPPPHYNLPPMPPAHLLPPGMRPRQLVIPAGAEPLPVRDPLNSKMAANGSGAGAATAAGLKNGSTSKGSKITEAAGRAGPTAKCNVSDDGKRRCHCCRGPALPIIWFIVTIITVGVVLGVILASIYGKTTTTDFL